MFSDSGLLLRVGVDALTERQLQIGYTVGDINIDNVTNLPHAIHIYGGGKAAMYLHGEPL